MGWSYQHGEALTSVEQIARVLDAMPGAPGIVRAREALELVGDGSNSPMESVLCALLTWPRRLGGYALGPVSLNHRVSTADGDRYVDVAFPGHKVGLEYKGRKFHTIDRSSATTAGRTSWLARAGPY